MNKPRPLTPEDVERECNRLYDMGRKHAKGEITEILIEPAVIALDKLLLASSKLRIRIRHSKPEFMQFSEWGELTEAMKRAEQVLKLIREKSK